MSDKNTGFIKKIRQDVEEGVVEGFDENDLAKVLLISVRKCIEQNTKEIVCNDESFFITDSTIECLREFSKAFELTDPLMSVEIDEAIKAYEEHDWSENEEDEDED